MTCTELINQLKDKAEPASIRAEAARRLLLECHDYSVWETLCSVAAAEDEDTIVRCAALWAMPRWNHYFAVNFLTRGFRDEQLRATAIAMLKEMGPVEGRMEAALLGDLSAIRARGANACLYAANLPGKYGRDPRVLDCLEELLTSEDEQLRLNAVSALCILGEPAPALALAGDPSPDVRAGLCHALGLNLEQSGVEALWTLLNDRDPQVSKEAKKALRLLGKLDAAKPGRQANEGRAESFWPRLLGELSRVRLADPYVAMEVPDSMVEANWLGEPAATEQEIEAAERRLGVRLPPSYRQFLAESNGMLQLSPFIYKLYGADEVAWFRTQNTEWIEAYQVGDDAYADVPPRMSDLWSCLQISEEGDSAVVLLNPEVVTADGEWETWFFANWVPGADTYRSFREYMEHELESAHRFSAQH